MASNDIRVVDVELPGDEPPAQPADAEPIPSATDPDFPDNTQPASRYRFDPKEFMLQLGQDMQQTIRSRFRNLQGTIHTQLRNLQDNVANLRQAPRATAEELHRRRVYHYDHSDLHIRSVRKLFDVIEQHYSWISILLLLMNVGLESAAFGIYLSAQRAHVPVHWLQFDWGTGYFIAEVVLSAIFMSSWIALLAVESKKMAYVLNVRSLMSYLSSGWMLLLGFGAACSGNPAWTRVYAPMFLRIWWLHEGLITLLSYPQISLWFAENRLEMLRSMIQCIAVIGISVGILQAVESFCGDPIEYFDMVYMMMLAFSTIGYGDIVPITVEGRMLMIIFIGVGLSYFVPLLEYVADLGVRHLFYAHYTTWFKRSNHIVICGNLGYNELRMQLKNILAEDRHYLNMNVVILLTDHPSAQVELLLNSPKYRSSVHLLIGDPSDPMDLDRCNVRGASALFLYGAGTNSSYYSDYDLAKQAMTANLHVPHVPLYVLLHRSRYTKALMPASANVLEFERLSHNLLGLGCVLPGMIPFLANLIRMFDPMTTEALWELRDFKDLIGLSGGAASLKAAKKMWTKKRDMLTYGAANIEVGDSEEPNWMSTYEASLAQHVDTVDAPAVVQQGHYTFVSLARLLYRSDITLIGVERPVPETWNTRAGTVVELGTRNSLVGVLKLIVICDARRKAQDIVDEIVMDALTNPSTSGTPIRRSHHHRRFSGKRKKSGTASPVLPPPPANVQATNVTVLDAASTEDVTEMVSAALHPNATKDRSASPPSTSGPSSRSPTPQPTPQASASPSPPPQNSAITAAAPAKSPTTTAATPVAAAAATTTPTTKTAAAPSSTAAVVMRSKKELAGDVSASLPAGLRADSFVVVNSSHNSNQHNTSPRTAVAPTLPAHARPTSPPAASPSTTPTTKNVTTLSSPASSTGGGGGMRPAGSATSTGNFSVSLTAHASTSGDVPRMPRPMSRRDVTVSLSNPVTNLALAAADDDDDVDAMEAVASPLVMHHAAAAGLPKVSSVASLTSSARGTTPASATAAAQSKYLPTVTSASCTPQGPAPPRLTPGSGNGMADAGGDDAYGAYAGSPAGLLSDADAVLKIEHDVMHLQHHYVFIDLSSAHERTNWSREAAVESRTAKAADYFDAMRPVRQHDPDSEIVLLSNDTNYDYLNNMWEEEDVTGTLVLVQGCGLFTSDLRRCNVTQAAAIVIFSAGDRCDEHGDSLSILVMHLVRQLIDESKSDGAADIPIVVEVDHAELVPFFSNAYMTTGKNAQTSSEWVSEPTFMSGCVVCRHMLDTGLQEMYFTPLLQEVLQQILSSKSESLLVTVMAPDEAWRTYEDATSFGLENDLLPLAIHRFHEMLNEDNSVSFRYIITNPPPTFPLHSDDFIYCLKL